MLFIKKHIKIKYVYHVIYYFCLVFCAWLIARICIVGWEESKKREIELELKSLSEIKDINLQDRVFFLPEERTIYICGWLDKKMAAETCKYLLSMRNEKKMVNLNLLSRGGNWGATTQIIDLISILPYKVNTIARGRCYYAMIYLLASGTGIRTVNSKCFFKMMNNRVYGSEYGKVGIKKFKDIAVKAHIELPEFKGKTFYFSTQDALKYKIVDKIIGE